MRRHNDALFKACLKLHPHGNHQTLLDKLITWFCLLKRLLIFFLQLCTLWAVVFTHRMAALSPPSVLLAHINTNYRSRTDNRLDKKFQGKLPNGMRAWMNSFSFASVKGCPEFPFERSELFLADIQKITPSYTSVTVMKPFLQTAVFWIWHFSKEISNRTRVFRCLSDTPKTIEILNYSPPSPKSLKILIILICFMALLSVQHYWKSSSAFMCPNLDEFISAKLKTTAQALRDKLEACLHSCASF